MILATVNKIVGTVLVVNDSGERRQLELGDEIFPNDVISTQAGSAVDMVFADGQTAALGQNIDFTVDDAFLSSELEEQVLLAENEVEDAALIALGDDPSLTQEATAAGGQGEQSGNEGSDFVQIEYLAQRATPDVPFFDTSGLGASVPEIAVIDTSNFLTAAPTASTEPTAPAPSAPTQPQTGIPAVPVDDDVIVGPIVDVTVVQLDEDDLSPLTQTELDALVNLKALFDSANTFSNSAFAQITGLNDLANGDDLPINSSTTINGSLAIDFGDAGAQSSAFLAASFQPANLTSAGKVINFWIADDGQTLIAYTIDNQESESPVAEIIFSVELNSISGDFTASLFGVIDHPEVDIEDNVLVNLALTVTDTNAASAQAVLQLDIDDDMLAPIDVQSLADFTYQLSLTSGDSTKAGFDNSFGYYIKGENGEPTTGVILWHNVKEQKADSFDFSDFTPEQIGFFIVPNGGNNTDLADGVELEFSQNNNGAWKAYQDGIELKNVFFDNAAYNKGGIDRVVDNEEPGNMNWEDLGLFADNDFNDVNIDVVWSVKSVVGTSTINFGADGAGSVNFSSNVSVFDGDDNAVASLFSNGKAVVFEAKDTNNDGNIDLIGSTEDGEVLTLQSVFDTQEYIFNLLAPIDNPIDKLVLKTQATAVDGDGDTAPVNVEVSLDLFFPEPAGADLV